MNHHLQYLWNKDGNAPIIVKTDVIQSVYRFDQPTCFIGNCQTTCKHLSSCLNGLLKVNVSDEVTCNGTESDSTVEKLQTHTHNGLKNYGSTCYLNAFLQLYFRFKELRKAIYDIPSQGGIVDPGGLIEALRLCDTEQQDAPEFHCLFMNLLQARFQQVGVSVIDDLIRGEYIYETSCLKCGFTSRLPSKFLELSLKVSSKTLPDCIRDYLKEEQLIGDNQYACSQCGRKRDGIRRVYITHPGYRTYRLCGVLLHIGNQPTSGHYIAVLRDSYKSIGSSQDKNKELSVEVDDPLFKSNECWSVCNDIDVFNIPSNQFKLAKINGTAKSLQSYLTSIETSDSSSFTKFGQPSDKYYSCKAAKIRRLDTSVNGLIPTDISEYSNLWHSSTNAYMVFYESVDNSNINEDIAVPDELRKTIEEVNLTEQQKLSSERQNKVNRKNQLLRVLSDLKLPDPINSPQNDDGTLMSVNPLDDVSLVSTSWLSDCLNNLLLMGDTCSSSTQTKSLTKLKEYIFPSSLPSRSSYALRTCSHGHVPTDLAAGSYRAVSTEGLKKLIDILFPKPADSVDSDIPRLNQFQPCKKCILLNAALLKVKNTTKELSKELDYFTRTNHLSSSYHKRLQNEESKSSASNNEVGYYLIGKRSLRQWKTLARHFTRARYCNCDDDTDSPTSNHFHTQTAFNRDILCSHGQLCTENARYLPAVLWHRLIDLFPGAKIPTFPVYIPYNNDTPIDAVSILNKSESSCSKCNAVQVDLTKRALYERQLLPGLFLSNVQRMRLLQSTGQTTTVNMKEDTVNKCDLDTDEGKNIFKSQNLYSNSSDFDKEPNNVNTNALYLIPMDFVIQWRKFIRNPTEDNLPSSLLSGFSTDGVLCEHGQLLKTWQALINESTLCPLTFYEWDILSHAYPHHLKENDISLDQDGLDAKSTSYPIMYLLPQNDSELKWRLEPSSYDTLCSNCQSQFATGDQIYNNARIRIRLVTGFDEALSNCIQSQLTSLHDSIGCISQDSRASTEICPQLTSEVPIPDNSDQVGATQTRVLTVDAKLVFAPYVRLPTTIHERFMELDNLNEIKHYFSKRCNLEQSKPIKDTIPPPSDNEVNLNQSSSSPEHHCQQQQHVLSDNTNIQSPNNYHHLESSSMNYIRRSTRQRLNPKDLLIKVNSSDTLLNMKVQIMQILGVMPSDQHIMSYGVELVDNTKTLQELGVYSKSILCLWTDDPTWDPNRTSFDNGAFKLATQKSKSNSPCKSTTGNYYANIEILVIILLFQNILSSNHRYLALIHVYLYQYISGELISDPKFNLVNSSFTTPNAWRELKKHYLPLVLHCSLADNIFTTYSVEIYLTYLWKLL
ncbi:Ubiquitin carboxyl-terminal hydrolase 48 [Schistosoma japonicum]|nr:Ubiquitin carboxyl-terminal hydrolase 48 [Schistosoma japonicum]KAH8851018.1 Ubiquitin carboxyl-terminal hydrolase 48 [Schistosoma japonicum]